MAKNVLIVDDERDIRILLQLFFNMNGVNVVGSASNGQSAVELYRSFVHVIDFVIMDFRMPLKNGIEATIEILAIDPSAKIIFSSADNHVKKDALSIGAVAFISKPYSFDKLMSTIQDVLGG